MRNFIFALVVNVILLCTSQALYAQKGVASPSPRTRIVILGDSITAGYSVAPQSAYPALLEKELLASGAAVTVINGGQSGDTTSGGLRRVRWLLQQGPVDIFILALGANDALRGLDLQNTERNLTAILELVHTLSPQCVLVVAGMKAPPNMGIEYTTRFSELYPRIASSHKAVLIPFLLDGVAGEASYNTADGIHPNEEGHKKIARMVGEALSAYISIPKSLQDKK